MVSERSHTMPIRSAKAVWKGTLKEGQGHLKLESGAYEGPYTWASRFADASGTNPEELIGAAHAGCYAMFLSALLTNNSTPPEELSATAKVHLGDGPTITKSSFIWWLKCPVLTQKSFRS